MSQQPSTHLPVNDIFYSFQGEGMAMGMAAFFIRLQGCPLRCHWCDSVQTWDGKSGRSFTPQALADMAAKTPAQIVVITGGEPAIHDLQPLTQALKAVGKRVHIETSGAFSLRGTFDWITLSPKLAKLPLPENVRQADEFKIIVDSPAAIDEWIDLLSPISARCKAIWLHPEWSQHRSPTICAAIVTAVKKRAGLVRAGIQLHKYYAADEFDGRDFLNGERSADSDADKSNQC